MSLTTDVMVLGMTPLFKEFGQEELRLIAFGARKRPFRESEVVHHEGRSAEGAAVVAEGTLRVETEAGDLGRAGPYSLLDEGALLVRRPHTYTATAESDGALIIIDRALMRRMIEEFPNVGERMKARIAERLARIAERAELPLKRLAETL